MGAEREGGGEREREREGEREREDSQITKCHFSERHEANSDKQFGHRSIICSTCEGGIHVLMD